MKNVRSAVSEALLSRGYSRDGRMHLKRLTSELSWVVDTGPIEGNDDVAPFVGIRHEGLEALVGWLLGLPLDRTVASVGDNVGFLVSGSYQSWNSPKQSDDVISAVELAQNRLLPYLTLQNLFGVWELTSRSADPAWRYREVAQLLLLGRPDSALTALDAARTHYCQEEDELCAEFRSFEGRVHQYLDAMRTP